MCVLVYLRLNVLLDKSDRSNIQVHIYTHRFSSQKNVSTRVRRTCCTHIKIVITLQAINLSKWMKMNEALSSKLSPYHSTHSKSFSFVKAFWKLLLWCEIALCISFNVPHTIKSFCLLLKFHFRKLGKVGWKSQYDGYWTCKSLRFAKEKNKQKKTRKQLLIRKYRIRLDIQTSSLNYKSCSAVHTALFQFETLKY